MLAQRHINRDIHRKKLALITLSLLLLMFQLHDLCTILQAHIMKGNDLLVIALLVKRYYHFRKLKRNRMSRSV